MMTKSIANDLGERVCGMKRLLEPRLMFDGAALATAVDAHQPTGGHTTSDHADAPNPAPTSASPSPTPDATGPAQAKPASEAGALTPPSTTSTPEPQSPEQAGTASQNAHHATSQSDSSTTSPASRSGEQDAENTPSDNTKPSPPSEPSATGANAANSLSPSVNTRDTAPSDGSTDTPQSSSTNNSASDTTSPVSGTSSGAEKPAEIHHPDTVQANNHPSPNDGNQQRSHSGDTEHDASPSATASAPLQTENLAGNQDSPVDRANAADSGLSADPVGETGQPVLLGAEEPVSNAIAIIDTRVDHYEQLVSAAQGDVVLVNEHTSLGDITETLRSTGHSYGNMEVWAHSSGDGVVLGQQEIRSEGEVDQYSAELEQLASFVDPRGSIGFFGCKSAETAGDIAILSAIAAKTERTVRGSSNDTGRGGDFVLEYASDGSAPYQSQALSAVGLANADVLLATQQVNLNFEGNISGLGEGTPIPANHFAGQGVELVHWMAVKEGNNPIAAFTNGGLGSNADVVTVTNGDAPYGSWYIGPERPTSDATGLNVGGLVGQPKFVFSHPASDVSFNIADLEGGLFFTTSTVTAYDANGNALQSITLSAAPGQTEFVAASQRVSFSATGIAEIRFDLAGGDGVGVNELQYKLQLNDPPNAVDDSNTVHHGDTVTGNVLTNDSDPDGDSLTASLATTPAHGSVSVSSNGAYSYTANAGYVGNDTFTYTINDGNGGTDTATVHITVTNNPPDAVNDAETTNEDTAVSSSVTANDSEPDGDPVTYSLVSNPVHGSVSFNSDGTYTYTPAPDFNGSDSFNYRITDNAGAFDVATVNITVNPVNDPAVAVDDNYSTNEDVAITVSPGVMNNDVEPDGDPIHVTQYDLSSAHGGTVAMDPSTGNFTYTPPANFNGVDTFTYRIHDNTSEFPDSSATVTITIAPVNDNPVAVNDEYSTIQDQPLTITPPGTLVNDTDIENDPLTISAYDNATTQGGAVIMQPDGRFVYTPPVGFHGDDTFTYTISDGNGGTDTATVTIKVNGPPVATDDVYTVTEDDVLTIPTSTGVNNNDYDVDGDSFAVSDFDSTSASGGTVVVNPDGSFSYTPAANFNGVDTFDYTIKDSVSGLTSTATVTLNVTPVNDQPVAEPDTYSTAEDTPLTVPAPGNLVNDSDVDGDPLTVTYFDAATSHGGVISANPDGSFSYTPAPNFNGVDTFTYTISDGQGGTDTTTVTINVTPVNDPPVALDDPVGQYPGNPGDNTNSNTTGANPDLYRTRQDEAISVDAANGALANDYDVDGDPLTVIRHDAVTEHGGAVEMNPDGSFSYTPAAGFSGSDTFTYTVSDGQGGEASAVVTILVDKAPQPVSPPLSRTPVAPPDVPSPIPLKPAPAPEPVLPPESTPFKGFVEPPENPSTEATAPEELPGIDTLDRFIVFNDEGLRSVAEAYVGLERNIYIDPTVQDQLHVVDAEYHNGKPEERVRWQARAPVLERIDQLDVETTQLTYAKQLKQSTNTVIAMLDALEQKELRKDRYMPTDDGVMFAEQTSPSGNDHHADRATRTAGAQDKPETDNVSRGKAPTSLANDERHGNESSETDAITVPAAVTLPEQTGIGLADPLIQQRDGLLNALDALDKPSTPVQPQNP